MDSIKWLQRKYPKSFDELNEYFDSNEIENFKKSTLKIGRLTKNVYGKRYKRGSIIQFRRSNPINDYNHPFVYAVLKCKHKGYTASGYHSFDITEKDFIEIFE